MSEMSCKKLTAVQQRAYDQLVSKLQSQHDETSPYHLTMLKAMNTKRMSVSDRDTLTILLEQWT